LEVTAVLIGYVIEGALVGVPEERRSSLAETLIKQTQISSTASSVLPCCVITDQSTYRAAS
jgi:hypothetical protein